MRDPAPLTVLFTPFEAAVFGGYLNPVGGRFELSNGDGDEWEDLAPFIDVWTIDGGGRLIFCNGGAGLAEMAVAIVRARTPLAFASSWT